VKIEQVGLADRGRHDPVEHLEQLGLLGILGVLTGALGPDPIDEGAGPGAVQVAVHEATAGSERSAIPGQEDESTRDPVLAIRERLGHTPAGLPPRRLVPVERSDDDERGPALCIAQPREDTRRKVTLLAAELLAR